MGKEIRSEVKIMFDRKINIALKVKLKNGSIQKFLDDRGWTQADLAREVGASQTDVGSWINMQRYPNEKYLIKICALLNKGIDEVFPETLKYPAIKGRKKAGTFYRDIPADDLLSIEDNYIKQITYTPQYNESRDILDNIMNVLNEQERTVIEKRYFDEKRGSEVADELDLCRNRIMQIEHSALHKLKYELKKKKIDIHDLISSN